MISIVQGLFVGVALLMASVSDMKTREVPDMVSYLLIITGLIFASISSIVTWNLSWIINSLLGFIAMALVSLALYFGGQWGGGDAKLLIGIGAWLGLTFSMNDLFMFLFNCVIVGGIYGSFWAVYLGIKNWKKFAKEFSKNYLKRRKVGLSIVCILIIIALATFFFLDDLVIKMLIGMLPIIAFFGLYLFTAVKSVELVSFYKTIPVSKLTEGDWVVKDVKVKGRVIVKHNDIGISKKDLIKVQKSGVKKIEIKEGIPFVPAILIAYIVTWICGYWVFSLF